MFMTKRSDLEPSSRLQIIHVGLSCVMLWLLIPVALATETEKQNAPRHNPVGETSVMKTGLTKREVNSSKVTKPGPPPRANYLSLPVMPSSAFIELPHHLISRGYLEEQGQITGGSACTTAADCEDCNACTTNDCVEGFCFPVPLNGPNISGCDDGLACNGQESCSSGVCTNGAAIVCGAGAVCMEDLTALGGFRCDPTCSGDGDCDDGLECTADQCLIGAGVCVYSNVCGPDASCLENAGGPICGTGRCCDATGVCSEETFVDCTGSGGNWLASDDACSVGCPTYSAGLAPQGSFTVSVGPISNLACDSIFEIGDDYVTANFSQGAEFMQLEVLRFVGGVFPGASVTWKITFYDQNGTFIEDVFWPDGFRQQPSSLTTNFQVNQVNFDEPLIIPTQGFVTFSVQNNFSPAGRVILLGTDVVDVGTNNPDVMWQNGAIVTAGDSGAMAAGERTLPFELVGTKIGSPLGACCTDLVTPTCQQQLPWVCEEAGGIFQGVDTVCSLCSNDFFLSCTDALDCPDACDNDPSIPCVDNFDCGGGTCVVGGATCDNVFQTCQASACCLPSGDCTGVISATDCGNLSGSFLGFGTTCAPNCCEQTIGGSGSAADTCLAAVSNILALFVPLPGEPAITITISDNNSASTFGDFVPVGMGGPGSCNLDIFDPEGETRDRGWWHAFQILTCANVRIDQCCTEARTGEPHVPQWAFLMEECNPCTGQVLPSAISGEVGNGLSATGQGGPFCEGNDLWQTYRNLPAGAYYFPIYSAPNGRFGDYQLHITAKACEFAVCCLGNSCSLLNELDCDAAGGNWLGLGNTAFGGEPIVTCGLVGGFSPCQIGSCCLGPGLCEDRSSETPCHLNVPATCMDSILCDTFGGNFVSGTVCSDAIPPCRVCDMASTVNCTLPDFASQATWQMSDLSVTSAGVTAADDFIANNTTISSVCAWGAYLTRNSQDPNIQFDGDDCSSRVTDNFRVRVYGDINGRPNFVLGESHASFVVRGPVATAISAGTFPGTQTYEYSLSLDTPISGLNPGFRYWLEIVNNTEEDDTCAWHWYHTNTGNNISNVGTGSVGYLAGSERSNEFSDLAWCVDQSIFLPDVDQGFCCDCFGTCFSSSLADCTDQWFSPDVTPTLLSNDDCVNAIPTTGNPLIIATDTTCSTTDAGAPSHGSVGFGSDIWYEYTATCTGNVVISMCGSGNQDATYDSAIAVYRNAANPTTCACPPTSTFTGGTLNDLNEGCNSLSDGGAGILQASAVFPGDCLLIRVGGANQERGRGMLTITCQQASAPVPPPPVAEDLGFGVCAVDDDCPGLLPCVGGVCYVAKNRFLSLSSGGAIEPAAIRVILADLPAPYDLFTGLVMWVGQPREICENSGIALPFSGSCPPAMGTPLGQPGPSFWASTLQCDPLFLDWSLLGVFHVTSSLVIPDSTYIIQTLHQSGNPALESDFSDPISITTKLRGGQSMWGDTVGTLARIDDQLLWTPPNGIVTLDDVLGSIAVFQNRTHASPKVWVDLEPSVVDFKISLIDLTFTLDGFLGRPYPFAPPQFPCFESVSHQSADALMRRTKSKKAQPPIPLHPIDHLVSVSPEKAIVTGPRVLLVPVEGDGCITGHEITLNAPGQSVKFDVMISHWDENIAAGICCVESNDLSTCDFTSSCLTSTDCAGTECLTPYPNLSGYNIKLDAASFSNGSGGALTLSEISCTTDFQCELLFGPGSDCTTVLGIPNRCAPAFIDTTRNDRAFSETTPFSAVFLGNESVAWLSVLSGAPFVGDNANHTMRYVGSLVIDVPSDALGTYTLKLKSILDTQGFEAATFLSDDFGFHIDISRVDATITFPTFSPTLDAPQAEPNGINKNRFLSFVPSNPGKSTALLVKLDNAPDHDTSSCTQWWVSSPSVYCENSGQQLLSEEPKGCGQSPGLPNTFLSSSFQCTKLCMDWGAITDVIHIGDKNIVPNATYTIHAVSCDPEELVSPPLSVSTTSVWGDVDDGCMSAACACDAPNGVVDIVKDVTDIIDKFRNLDCSLAKVRADLEPFIVDRVINITDVKFAIDAFRQQPYPFASPQGCP